MMVRKFVIPLLENRENLPKPFIFLLRTNVQNNSGVTITGKAENRGDAKGMIVPCRLG